MPEDTRRITTTSWLIGMATAAACSAPQKPPSALDTALARRFAGDRTGACVAAAIVEARPGQPTAVTEAFRCADPARARGHGPDTSFEIGSVTKTMTGALLADLVAEGRLGLDDPLERHLPPGTKVPSHAAGPIRLVHLATHTSGLPALPARMAITDPDNPYAKLDEEALLGSLADVTLAAAPGTSQAYSNFAVMVLSYVLGRAAGSDYGGVIGERLLAPLGMRDSYVSGAPPPARARAAAGHLPTGQPTSAWDIPTAFAGVGGVRASLRDMVKYAEAALGRGPERVVASLARSQARAIGPTGAVPETGLGWGIATIGGRRLLLHEGGTGGFSAFLGVDPAAGRAVVLLSDTALHSLGGLEPLGLHLLDVGTSPGEPRKVATPAPELLEALAGRYRLAGGLGIRLWHEGGVLHGQADGQGAFALGHDSHGDFYPLTFDALLTPRRGPGGTSFVWTQAGGQLVARRETAAGAAPDLRVANAADYLGVYPLAPGFALTITTKDGRLFGAGTNQPALPLTPAGRDVFVADEVAAQLTFERDAAGVVAAVTLEQGGQRLRGDRQRPGD